MSETLQDWQELAIALRKELDTLRARYRILEVQRSKLLKDKANLFAAIRSGKGIEQQRDDLLAACGPVADVEIGPEFPDDEAIYGIVPGTGHHITYGDIRRIQAAIRKACQ